MIHSGQIRARIITPAQLEHIQNIDLVISHVIAGKDLLGKLVINVNTYFIYFFIIYL